MSQRESARDASRQTESDRFPPSGTLGPQQLWSAKIRFNCLDERKCNPFLYYVSVSRLMRDVAGGCLDNGIGIPLNKQHLTLKAKDNRHSGVVMSSSAFLPL